VRSVEYVANEAMHAIGQSEAMGGGRHG
jgi:hypothetical protein